MARVYVSNAPFIQKDFIVTQAFSESHHALDLAPYGGSQPLYAIDNMTIIYSYNDRPGGSTYGNYFIAKCDNPLEQKMYLYAHMATNPDPVGTQYNIHDYVGMAGRTDGESHTSSGIHLHLEMQQGTSWNYNAPFYVYINPCDYLTDITNVASSARVYYYDGTPVPPTPTYVPRKHFPWFIYQHYDDYKF